MDIFPAKKTVEPDCKKKRGYPTADQKQTTVHIILEGHVPCGGCHYVRTNLSQDFQLDSWDPDRKCLLSIPPVGRKL